MTVKVNGFSATGQRLTGGLDYFTLTTAVNIMPSNVEAPYGTFVSVTTGLPLLVYTDAYGVVQTYANQTEYDAARAQQIAFDKVVEIISGRGQPVIMGFPVATGNSLLNSKTGTGPYTFRWAGEHRDAWYNMSQGTGKATYSPTNPVVAATYPYDAVPDLAATIVAALGSSITLYAGTSDSQTITWSTAFVAGTTTIAVSTGL